MGDGERKHLALLFVLLTAIVLSSVTGAWAGGGPRDVLVVINARSSESVEIGRYYQAARGIPESNICSIWCPEAETASWSVIEAQVREPIRRFLARPEIAGRIHYIVVTRGIPLAADYVADNLSTASVLVDLDEPIVDLTGDAGIPDGKPDNADPLTNPYGPAATGTWGFTAPQQAWSYDLFDSGDAYDVNKRFYLVTRLDGFSVQQIKNTIDRSVVTALDGDFVLDRNLWNTGAYKYANSRLGSLISSAYYYLVGCGCAVHYDDGVTFISDLRGLMGYFSWASNDEHYTLAKYTSNVFVPGAVADTYYSYSGRTFVDPGTTDRGPLIADLFAAGVCGVGGYVSEPFITTATYPNVLFDRYTRGFNMAESFYAACPNLKWKTVVAGDPLMAPYATPPTVSISVDDTTFHDVETITVNASDDSGISKVRVYIGDKIIAETSTCPYTVQIDTCEYPIGAHTIEAIAYENSPTATQGSAKLQVVVDNQTSAVATISDALTYGNGQYVRLMGKVVTAGSEEIGDGFYIEDWDRSSAVKVLSGQELQRGDVVTVTGPLTTVGGERAIEGAIVTCESSGATLPRPMCIPLRDLGGPGVDGVVPPVGVGCGARNTALLVRVVGRVTSSQDGRFCITDGSPKEPTAVICPGVAQMAAGALVAVTGLSAAEQSGSVYSACLRARSVSDIELL